ncbi:MAG TPA: NADP(H)-dependent aldo-keto reductase [Flavobacterium sp.]|uniref:NADP(H)-dependent aldo-keto reductase n=1 Tax=unclassified Flavobacterium TaxID=196869 RepID=UPI000E8AE5DC|nr:MULTISPECIES: NADP(H)-dependent aldo-keto reductase [unclassified Flavobacterium]HBI01029.1 NADP(H)-dependent aldo-keto reductase [Flavobacterium sp.]HRE76348.1 NADP(H)-dependent aldo-keto reductase [Flavobacterium sp.]
MKTTTIPNTSLKISKICLGTMTFGEQNSESDAHEQLDNAVSRGINFIDTAEMYPIASRKETLGSTERFIGSWLKKHGKREDLVIATKIAGPNRGMDYIRQPLDFSAKSIKEAVDLSLKNLQTDYIDLYQMHWPERVMNMFGKRGLTEIDNNWKENFAEVLSVYDELIKAGKIRHIGVSNEAPWAVMKFISESEKHNLPRIATIQNPYSLLNRLFEVGLTEVCMRENIGLMAYSPLGFGILSGKHLNGTKPNSRIDLFPQFTRYTNENATKATKLYQELAHSHGLTLAQMALAFVQQQQFVMSTIIGATSLKQLKENIDSLEIVLSEEILKEIDAIQEMIPNPAP